MPLISTTQHCDSVRRAIDPSIKKRKLPDDVILDPIYAGQAEVEVRKVTDDNTQPAFLAAVFLCAASLLESIPAITQETQGDTSYTRAFMDPAKRAARLRQKAADQLALTAPLPVPDIVKSDDFSTTKNVPVKAVF
jgi:hypothetical protein